MSHPSPATHLVVVDPDVSVAKAVTTLALDVLPPHTETLIAKTPTEDGARRIISALPDADARLIVVCAAEIEDGGKGLEVLRFVRAHRPSARVLLLTGSERRDLARALVSGADGVLTKPLELDSLRAVLAFLGAPPEGVDARPLPAADHAGLRTAIQALEIALLAVESAADRVDSSSPEAVAEARHALREAELLASKAHRRALEAERALAQSQSTTS